MNVRKEQITLIGGPMDGTELEVEFIIDSVGHTTIGEGPTERRLYRRKPGTRDFYWQETMTQ